MMCSLSPGSYAKRRLRSEAGNVCVVYLLGVAVGLPFLVGVRDLVTVACLVADGVLVSDGVNVCDGVNVSDGVRVMVRVAVAVGVRDGVADGLPCLVGVRDLVGDSVLVGDFVGPLGVLVAGAAVRVAVNTAPGVPMMAMAYPSPNASWVTLFNPDGIEGTV